MDAYSSRVVAAVDAAVLGTARMTGLSSASGQLAEKLKPTQ